MLVEQVHVRRNPIETPRVAGALIVLFTAISASAQEREDEPATSPSVTSYLERALDIMEAYSIKRDAIDWPSFRAEALRSATGMESIEQAHAVLRTTIRKLGDGHSHLIPSDVARARSAGGATSEGLSWFSPTSEALDEHVSYVTVPSYVGSNPQRMTRYADELQAAIRAVDSATTCGWIVDLRSNGGGTVFPMIAGIGPLAGEGELAGGVRTDGGRYIRWYRDGRVGVGPAEQARVSGEPYALHNPGSPVAILIGPGTASSGEATALAFVGHPRTRVFGLPSAGLTTGNTPFPLQDGAVLNLAVSVMMDRAGQTYGGEIEPDERVEETEAELPLTEQPVVRRAMAWLNSQMACEER